MSKFPNLRTFAGPVCTISGQGQVGDGSTVARKSPVSVASGVAAVACGAQHNCVIMTASGGFRCWGSKCVTGNWTAECIWSLSACCLWAIPCSYGSLLVEGVSLKFRFAVSVSRLRVVPLLDCSDVQHLRTVGRWHYSQSVRIPNR